MTETESSITCRYETQVSNDFGDPVAAQVITLNLEHPTAADEEAAAGIAAELGYLPLALDQAAAYISQTQIMPAEYLKRLRDRQARMYRATGSGDSQLTIARLWDITIGVIRERNPAAARLLAVLACYAPDAIPRVMLGGRDSLEDTDEALGLLASYSLITLTPSDVSIHRVLQAVILSAFDKPTVRGRSARDIALDWLEDIIPTDPADMAGWPLLRLLVPHAEALSSRYPPGDQPEQLGRLYNQIGLFHQSQADHARALAQYQSALAITEAALGPDHLDTARTLGNLASTYVDLGRARDALPLEERAVAITEAALGPDHPDTARTLGNLASTHRALGQARRALRLWQRVLAITEAALGPDDLDTARTLGNLASTYVDLGRAGGALPLAQRALAITEAALGPDHVDTARALGDPASTYVDLGRSRDALPLAQRALAIAEAALGPDHLIIAILLRIVASAWNALGSNAMSLRQRALAITKAWLELNQTDVSGSLRDLVVTFRADEEAEEKLAQELVKVEEKLELELAKAEEKRAQELAENEAMRVRLMAQDRRRQQKTVARQLHRDVRFRWLR